MNNFNAIAVRDSLCSAILKYMNDNHFNKIVIGVSGGKDSAVAAALCARAMGPQNVYGVIMPNYFQNDLDDAIRVCKKIGINYKIVDIGKPNEKLLHAITQKNKYNLYDECPIYSTYTVDFDKESEINMIARLRMVTLRYITQSLNALLCGTGNLSEIMTGYFTIAGDSSWDFNPLGELTCTEVVELGKTMPEIPLDIMAKSPRDGLSNRTDEDRLGATYEQIDSYLRQGPSGSEEVDSKIKALIRKSEYKRNMPLVLVPEV